LMADIYSKAHLVMVWLGPGLDKTFEFLESCRPESFNGLLPLYASDAFIGDGHPHFDALLNASYWTRLGIVQEFLLAREIIFLSDTAQLSWQTMKNMLQPYMDQILQIFLEQKSSSYRFMLGLSLVKLLGENLAGEWQPFEETEQVQLLNFLWSFQDHSCSQILDRVYSVIGLIESWRGPGKCPIPVDYSLEPIELFELIKRHFEKDSTFDSIFDHTLRLALGLTTS